MIGITNFLCFTFLIIILYFVNNTSTKAKKNIILGTMLPYGQLSNKEVLNICKEYKKANLYSSILFFLLTIPVFLINIIWLNIFYLLAIVFIIIYISGLILKKYMTKLRILKSDNDWFVTEKHILPSSKNSDHIIYTDDDEYWGPFIYKNPHDKNFMVEKRIGIGTTVNMANKTAKIFTIICIITTSATLIVVGALLFSLEHAHIELTNDNDNFNVSASMYHMEFNKDDIEDVSLIDKLPESGSKINGADSNDIAFGHFNYEGYDKCMVFIKKNNNSNIIVIKLNDKFKDRYILLSGDNQDETNEFYEKLKK